VLWIIAVVILLIVLGACLRLAHENRSLAERVVDRLYGIAAFAYAFAAAADMALCRYRSTRQAIREEHIPMYCSEER
jgi:hypothetical protein